MCQKEEKNCYNNAKIQGTSSYFIGGIVGISKSTNLSNCYNVGDVINVKTGKTFGDSCGIGEIIGVQSSNTETKNVFNIGNVISKDNATKLKIGGIVGRAEDKATAIINTAYNTGTIDANGLNSSQVGSIAGNDLVTFIKCFYLKRTFDIGVAGSGTPIDVTEWDSLDKFPSVLSVVNEGEEKAFKEDTNNINNGYPILSWQ